MTSATEHRAAARAHLERAEALKRGDDGAAEHVSAAEVHALLAIGEDLNALVALTKKEQRKTR